MARIRSVKPEFFTSETIASFSLPARLTFIGLWTHADDEGRAPDNPRLLKAAVWPLDDEITVADVTSHLNEFETAGRICRYTIDGKRYLHLVSWAEHQKPKNPSTRYPECPRQAHGGPELPQDSTQPVDALPQPSPSPPPALPQAGDKVSASRARLRDLGAGSREQGAGIPPTAGGAGAADTSPSTTSPTQPPATPAHGVVAAYVAANPNPVPADVRALLGRKAKQLLGEGFEADLVTRAAVEVAKRGLDVAMLARVVNELANPRTTPATSRGRPEHVTPPGAPRCEHDQHAKLCDICHPRRAAAPPPNLRAALQPTVTTGPDPPPEAFA